MKRILILLLTIFHFANLFAQNCSPDSLLHREIRAFTTDSNINWELLKHQIYLNPDCIQNNKLLLHLVGSFDNPANTTYLPILAANNGYKVINLKYPNSVAAFTACANSSDADCFAGFREEIIFGTESNSSVEVDENNCVVNRLEKLLLYLEDEFSTENWSIFLTNTGAIDWSNIIVSGHSQGGGHAAFIAKQFDVNRVLMFASPNDYSDFFFAPANWTSLPSVTPDSNYFAFGNLYDEVVDFSKQFEIWTAMNLATSDSVNVDISNCNYNNSRILYTEYESSIMVSGNHGSVVTDATTPFSGGIPVFTPIWEYMLGICEETTSVLETNPYIDEIKLFPNPTTSKVLIESELVISKVEVYDFSGALLKTVWPGLNRVELDVGAYEGLLLFKVGFGDIEVCKMVLVE